MSSREAHLVAALAAAFVTATGASAATLLSESFSGAAGTQPSGFVVDLAEGAGDDVVSQNDGDEYEQRFVNGAAPTGDAGAAGWYEALDDTDRGVWRDTSISVINRFSGGASTQTGLIFRASDDAGVDSGDWYQVRMVGGGSGTLELIRVNGGASSGTLASDATGGGYTDTNNQLLTVDVFNVVNPDHDHVRIIANLYAGNTVGSGVVRTIDFTDVSTDAITRSGGAGFRTTFLSGAGTRSVFDSLEVTSTEPNLLWYDDYYDDQAPRMQSFSSGTTQDINSTKYRFQSIGNGDRATASIDFDSHTATGEWENVSVSALMRWNTQTDGGRLVAGITARETGMTSATDGTYYLFALIRNEDSNGFAARIYRVIDGVLSGELDGELFGGDVIGESINLFLRLEAMNTATGVQLTAIGSYSQDLSDPFTSLSFLDPYASAIVGPGSAGFYASATGSMSSGVVNFDNFTVTHVPTPAALPAGLILLGSLSLRRRRAVNTK